MIIDPSQLHKLKTAYRGLNLACRSVCVVAAMYWAEGFKKKKKKKKKNFELVDISKLKDIILKSSLKKLDRVSARWALSHVNN